MKLSVIVLAYRCEKLLARCLASIRASAGEDVEIVVVRDTAPVGRARNEGLARATGDYVAWVDADDEVTPDWYPEIVRALESRPDVVVFGHTWVVSAADRRDKIWRGTDLLADLFAERGVHSMMWDKVVRRALWDGLRFDEAALACEDWEILPRLLVRAQRIVSVPRSLYLYHRRPGSLTVTASPEVRADIFRRVTARLALADEPAFAPYRRAIAVGVARQVAAQPDARKWLRPNAFTWMFCGLPPKQWIKCMIKCI